MAKVEILRLPHFYAVDLAARIVEQMSTMNQTAVRWPNPIGCESPIGARIGVRV